MCPLQNLQLDYITTNQSIVLTQLVEVSSSSLWHPSSILPSPIKKTTNQRQEVTFKYTNISIISSLII